MHSSIYEKIVHIDIQISDITADRSILCGSAELTERLSHILYHSDLEFKWIFVFKL